MKRNQKQFVDRVQKEKFARVQFPTLNPLNENQRVFMEALKYDSLVVAEGSAGVGKTMIACYHAARKLHHGDIKKIVLIRAYQPLAGRTIGYRPGSATDKLYGFYAQMLSYLEDAMGKAVVEIHVTKGTIEICALEEIRGRSWSDCVVLVDEAQSLLVEEVQALTTRIGDRAQLIFLGDVFQTDVKNRMNGLEYLMQIVQKYNIEDSCFVKFTKEDCVRSGLCKEFVFAYEDEQLLHNKGSGIVKEYDKKGYK